MLAGYNRVFNTFGLKSLMKIPMVPDSRLGVGVAETLAPVPIITRYDTKGKNFEDVSLMTKSTMNKSSKLQDEQVYQKEFPHQGWMGNPYGG